MWTDGGQYRIIGIWRADEGDEGVVDADDEDGAACGNGEVAGDDADAVGFVRGSGLLGCGWRVWGRCADGAEVAC